MKNDAPESSSEEYLRQHTVGELKQLSGPICLVEYDPEWPHHFQSEVHCIQAALGDRALRIEHTGSTAVPGLPAKPVIDIVLAVADSAQEAEYVPPLERAGYQLQIREPDWYEHRLLQKAAPEVNLHVFSMDCPEIERMLAFRDWLRITPGDRDLYAHCKRDLAQRQWKYTQDYADAKTAVIEEILTRARNSAKANV